MSGSCSVPADALRAIVAAGGTVFETAAGTIVVLPKRVGDADELLPLVDAARVAATTVRVLRDAIRAGELPAVGRQRDRSVRRRDLDAWIESRAHAPTKVDDEVEARVERRLARKAREVST
jgi:hypothetical protein